MPVRRTEIYQAHLEADRIVAGKDSINMTQAAGIAGAGINKEREVEGFRLVDREGGILEDVVPTDQGMAEDRNVAPTGWKAIQGESPEGIDQGAS